MKTFTRSVRFSVSSSLVVAGGLALVLGLFSPTPAAAQNLHEILIGTLGDIPADEFECGRMNDRKPCALNYRYYCVDEPGEINGPARPPAGTPFYRLKKKTYQPDPVHTGNFPKATMLGPGHAWNLVWDGSKNPDSPEHVGYYAAVSQLVQRNEMGNPMTATCLPVVGQYACFGRFGKDKGSLIQNTPLGDLNPIGGLSPTPVPLITRNGDDAISFAWEQASSQESRDGAPPPIQGYRLYIYPNPVTPPTDGELQDAAVAVGEVLPLNTTSFDLKRTDPALKRAVTLSAALRLVYTGPVESLYFSANGPATGLAYPDTSATGEMDDAAAGASAVQRAIDIEHLFLEVRQKKDAQGADDRVLVATVDLVGQPTGSLVEGSVVRLFIDFNDDGLAATFAEPGKTGTEDVTLTAELSAGGGGPMRARFSGLPGIEAHSRLESEFARVIFAIPVKQLTSAVSNDKLRASDVGGGQRQILVWAETTREQDRDRVPNTNDGNAPSVAGEVIRFRF